MQSGRDNLKQQVYFVQKKQTKQITTGGAVDSNNACSGLAMIIRPPRATAAAG